MSVPLTITTAGLAELVNASGTGTEPIVIAAIGVSPTAITADPAMTALPGELYRITTISGAVVAPDTIHVVMQDNTARAYSANSFALYLDDGTLFALYGQATPIFTKTAASIALLAIDVTFAAADASSITFGNADFINPPATATTMGVVTLATLAMAQAGTDNAAALTPATAKGAVLNWIGYTPLNTASYTAADVLTKIKTVDGTGSGLDADLLDGHDSSYFARIADLAGYVTPAYLAANIQALVAGCIAAVATAAGFSYYFGVNGYFKLPSWLGGVILQWVIGSYTSGDSAQQTVSWPIAFPTFCAPPVVGVYGALTFSGDGHYRLNGYSINNCTVEHVIPNTNYSSDAPIIWALGR